MTVPTSAYTEAYLAVGPSETTIQSLSLVSTGAPIQIIAACIADSACRVRIYREATIIFDSGNISTGNSGLDPTVFSTSILDVPGEGTFTYYLKAWNLTLSGGGFKARSLLTLEVKK